MKFRQRHNQTQNEYYGLLSALDFTNDPGKTLQAPAEEQDINVLMKRMGVKDGSELPHFESPGALFGDFTDMPTDPTEMANMLYEGQLNFLRLPAELRKRYETPDKLFAFMNDNSNYDEAVKLGLLERKPKQDTQVSPSTSSVKEPLVQTSTTTEKTDGKQT